MHPLILRVFIPLAGVAAIALAWHRFGWQGVVVVVTALVLWFLLHFNRLMQVLRRAAARPIGHVDSAVMLNAKLKNDVSLMHVIAMTRSLGQLQTVKDAQPEVYRWSDNTDSYVDATFQGGRLRAWQLVRPTVPSEPTRADAPPTKIGRFGAAVSHRDPSDSSSLSNPGAERAPDHKE